jgi:hypothetical protein
MSAPRSTASHASVAFLRIHDFAQQAVADQARLKARLEEVVAAALKVLRTDARIVLDAPEGIAVVVLANPRGALRLAWRAAADRELDLAVGLAHGPVRVAQGPLAVLYGDAFVAAEGVARAAARGGVSASREFRNALARSRPGLARLLAPSGSTVDAQDRAHETFRADRQSVSRRRWAFFGLTGIAAAGILSIGFAIRANRPPPVVPVLPGAVTFDIRPEGEIFVDGVLKGTSPPLKRIQLAAGNHLIEIRKDGHKPAVTELAIGPGEDHSVQHTFITAPQPAKPASRQAPRQAPRQKPVWERVLDWFKK